MSEAIRSLIAALKQSVSFLQLRTVSPLEDYLEAVIARSELERAQALLAEKLGPPIKSFDQSTPLERKFKGMVESLGGIRADQCLFLAEPEASEVVYAMLWPWVSDANRLTLKVGVRKLGK